ncbi:MAG TPA: hypothetical protein VGK49_01675, partial [Ilumatobacteraceae bacterium]
DAPKVDPATGRAVLGGRARREPAASAPAAPAEPEPASPAAPAASIATTPTARGSVLEVWESSVRQSLKPLVRALYHAGTFTGEAGGAWQFAVPNAAHRDKCEAHRAAVEAALTAATGSQVSIQLVVGGAGDDEHDSVAAPAARAPAKAAAAATVDEPEEAIDPDELTDAPPGAVVTPIDRLAQAFPGSELIDERG